ncbi:MAG: hypothetical protein IZT57_04950, partial [Chloroflexi bacterium]|nr:hypothetical protein [Chloroflexota bacterium]
LVNSFDQLGVSIGKALSGAEDALKSLGLAILQNLGNILIMAGFAMGPAGLPLIIAGAAMQIGGGIFKGLGGGVSPSTAVGNSYSDGGNVNFRISGPDLVGTLQRNAYSQNMNT